MKIFLFALLLLLSACGDFDWIDPSGAVRRAVPSPEPSEPPAEPDIEPEPLEPAVPAAFAADDVLRLHMRPPMTLNPLLNEDITVAPVLRLIFEPLAVLDDELRIVGNLAELEFASDFSSVNISIRDDAIWSDGVPVTSDDLIFTVETLRNVPQQAIYAGKVQNIAEMLRVDTKTVQFVFARASVAAGYSLNFPVIPRHIYQNEMNPQSPRNMNPVGNGPFIFQSHVPMRSLTLTRNYLSFRRRARINEVEVLFLPDRETDIYAFERGRIDALHMPLTDWTRQHSVRPLRFETFPAMYFEFIGFNFRRPFFRDVYTRQGIANAFNADEALAAVYLDHAVRAATPVHPQSWAASGVPGHVYDPSRAAALLRTVRLDAPLVILVNESNSQRVSLAERFAASLNAAGLEARAEAVPFDEYFSRLDTGDFDLYIGGVTLPFAPDFAFMFQGGLFYSDTTLEGLFSAIITAQSESAYIQAIRQFQQAFIERLPVIGLAFRHSAVLTNTRVQTGARPSPDNIFMGVNEWEIVRG